MDEGTRVPLLLSGQCGSRGRHIGRLNDKNIQWNTRPVHQEKNRLLSSHSSQPTKQINKAVGKAVARSNHGRKTLL